MGAGVACATYQSEHDAFPTDISRLPEVHTWDVDVTIFPVSATDFCVQATIDGGKITRNLVLSDSAPNDGPCGG